MRILGVDTGKRIDFVLLEVTDAASQVRFHLRGSGTAADPCAITLTRGWVTADLICIEEPAQILPSKRLERAGHRVAIGIGNRLMRTQGQARDIELLAVKAGIPCVRMTSSEARRAVGIRIGGRGAKPGDIDRQTGVLVPRLVSGWPAKSSNHRRDAAVVAIAGLAKWRMDKAMGERVVRA
jgi:hypothetical protein